MRRRYLIVPLMAIALLWMSIFAAGAWSELLVRGGSNPGMNEWHWPTGTEYHGGYLGWLDYSMGYKEYHLGRDFRAPVGSAVYAISSGTVLEIESDIYGSKSSRGSAVLILHRTSTGRAFIALYGHVTDVRVYEGHRVKAGELLAYLNDYQPSHLHFAINQRASRLMSDQIWRGYTPVTNETYGFVDPMAFLYKNRPETLGPDMQGSPPIARSTGLRTVGE